MHAPRSDSNTQRCKASACHPSYQPSTATHRTSCPWLHTTLVLLSGLHPTLSMIQLCHSSLFVCTYHGDTCLYRDQHSGLCFVILQHAIVHYPCIHTPRVTWRAYLSSTATNASTNITLVILSLVNDHRLRPGQNQALGTPSSITHYPRYVRPRGKNSAAPPPDIHGTYKEIVQTSSIRSRQHLSSPTFRTR